MRVRSSPFGAQPMPTSLPGVKPPPGPGAPPPQHQAAPAPAPSWDDEFDGFMQEVTSGAPTPPQQQWAPQGQQFPPQPMGVQPPPQGMGVQPPAQGMGVQPPAWHAPAPQQQQQAPAWHAPAPQQAPANNAFGQMQQPSNGYGQAPPVQPQQASAFFPGQAPPQTGPSMMQDAANAFLSAGLGGGGATGMAQQAILGAGVQQLENQLNQYGLTRWFPTIFSSLQSQFNVGHQFVLRKLLILLCPFVKPKDGAPPPSNYGYGGNASPGGPNNQMSGTMGQEGLKEDIEEADLYLPCMAQITYCLVYGIQRGMINDFKADVLGATFSFALVLFMLEVGLAKMGFYIAGSMTPFLEIVGNCGYKFVHVVLMVLIRILLGGSKVYYLFFLYFAACAAFTVWRFMGRVHPLDAQRYQYGSPSGDLRKHIILGLAIAQIPLCWLLTPSMSGKTPAAK